MYVISRDMNESTISMQRLLSSKHKNAKTFEKYLNPVMLVFIGKLSEYSPMSTDVPGFQLFFRCTASFCTAQISH